MKLRLLPQAAESHEGLESRLGYADDPVKAAEHFLLLRGLFPVDRVGARVAVNVLHGFGSGDKGGLLMHPGGIGHHDIRLFRKAHLQKATTPVSVSFLNQVLSPGIAQLFNPIPICSPAVVVMDNGNSRIPEFLLPAAAGILDKDGNLKFFLVQKVNEIKKSLLRTAADQLIVYKGDFNFSHRGIPSRVHRASSASGNRI